jgi:CRISPR-associated endonuclease Csn1
VKQNDYVLGLDIGITSVGWGIVDANSKVVAAGVRLFDENQSEKKKTNQTRREHRSSRRVKRRRKQRVVEMKRLLKREGIISDNFKPLSNPYAIRVKGLTQQLSNEELATALLHLAKRRGSSLEVVEEETTADEEKKLKATLSDNTQFLHNNNIHVCQLQLKRLNERGFVRGVDNVFKTEDYVKEAEAILKNQNKSAQFNEHAVELIARRRHFSEGPGSYESPTPYGRFRKDENGKVNEEPLNLIELMRGRCSVYPEELRAPKESFSAELHNFLNDLNNLKIHGEPQKLTPEQKQKLVSIIKEKGYLSPKNNAEKAVSKVIGISPDLISGFRQDKNEKPIITEFKGYQKFLKVLGSNNPILDNIELLDQISEILTSTKVLDERIDKITNLNTILDKKTIKDLALLPGFTQYHSFSFKALRLLNKEMMITSRNQMQIIHDQKLIKKSPIEKLVLDESLILSPVAKRAHREALKVVNELIKEFGHFRKVIIETAREKNSKEQKTLLNRMQKLNEKRNKEAEALLEGTDLEHLELNGKQKLKLRLYKEQDGKCAYTYNSLNIRAIVTNTDDYEIDHIIPYSISLDNSYQNKVLVERRANQLKGNNTPFKYFQSGRAYGQVTSYEKFKELVLANNNYSKQKKLNLTNEQDITSFDSQRGFIARNLVDTRYATRAIMTTLKEYFDSNDVPTIVYTMKGKNTNLYRQIGSYEYFKRYKFAEYNALSKDRDQYIHHAIDALICAGLAEQASLKRMYQVDRSKEIDAETGEVLSYDTSPMEDTHFLDFLVSLGQLEDKDIRFSWKVDTKPNRRFSDETIYSTRNVDGEEKVVKKYKNIYEMKNSDLEKMFKKPDKLLLFHNDPKTYEILHGIYKQYKHTPQPFASYQEEHGEKVRKYAKNGKGPFITDIKYYDSNLGNHLDISHNYKTKNKKVVLLQITPYRTDFYRRPNGKLSFVTIRLKDIKPIGDPINGQYHIPEDLYKQKLQEAGLQDAKFLYSFHRNEIIEIVKKEKDGTISRSRYRFVATNDDKAKVIEVKEISKKTEKRETPYVNSLHDIVKYAYSPIGKIKKIDSEVLKLRV